MDSYCYICADIHKCTKTYVYTHKNLAHIDIFR